MKYSTKVRMIVVLAILLLFSSVVAFAGNESMTNVANGNSSERGASLLNSVALMNISSNIARTDLSINGTVFNDLNGDGMRTENESSLPSWTITLAINGKTINQRTTDNAGLYSFENLSPGRYTVMENNTLTGWNQTYPGGVSYDINLVDKDAINYDFGNHYGAMPNMGRLTRIVQHPIMSKSAWLEHSQGVKKLSEIKASNVSNLTKPLGYNFPLSFSLLSHVPYIASERNQGYCGDCWVWGCTAPIEVAHDIQNGVHDRLSIQYLNSNYNGGSGSGWACCGGWEGGFADFYRAKAKFIPWSNSNAKFRDASRTCCVAKCDPPNDKNCCTWGNTATPASSISTSPNYPITSIQWNLITTTGTGITQDQAIKNIKAMLIQNKAVTLGFYLPDFTPFWDFWGSKSDAWNPDLYCGKADGAYPGGHEVTIVGYDDTNPSNRYWIVLNSWGIDSAHPDGTYKLKMDMNYNCMNNGYYSYAFGYFDVTFLDKDTCISDCIDGCPYCEELPPQLVKYCGTIIHACVRGCIKECGGIKG